MATRTRRPPAEATSPPVPPRFRINEVVLEGFKCFRDEFRLEIPPPEAEGDLDVIVIGGDNGSGKTSVLEAVALAITAHRHSGLGAIAQGDPQPGSPSITWAPHPERWKARVGRLVNADRHEALIRCVALSVRRRERNAGAVVGEPVVLSTTISRTGSIVSSWSSVSPSGRGTKLRADGAERDLGYAGVFAAILGVSPDVVLVPHFQYFHSYRRVAARDPELKDLATEPGDEDLWASHGEEPLSQFKVMATRALAGQKDFLNGVPPEEGQRVVSQVDALMAPFARGALAGRVQAVGSEMQLLVEVPGSSEPVPFDALSSGQKDIISTLSLIEEYTRGCPSVVLIDEPELHLHPQWHDDFVRALRDVAPQNQYIISTHSERIAESVPPGRVLWIEA